MKKSLWLLLVVAALIAVFAVAGCLPGATPEEPTEPEEPTTPTPTDYCPTSTTTTLQKLYDDVDDNPSTPDVIAYKLYITFDQPVFIQDLACYTDTDNWEVEVDRYVPYQKFTTRWENIVHEAKLTASIVDVSFINDKTFVVEFTVIDNLNGYTELICSEADYNAFIDAFNDPDIAATSGSIYADVISWSFDGVDSCGVVYDAQGNPCIDICELEGSFCCAVTYCEECEEIDNCPLTPGGCI